MKLIQGGLVKTITGGDIENGQILIDGGKIVAVGQNLDVPAGTEIIAAAVVVLLHVWRRNTLLSIVAGTVVYMLLVQLVFV